MDNILCVRCFDFKNRQDAEKNIKHLIQSSRIATSYVTIATYNAAKAEWFAALEKEKSEKEKLQAQYKEVICCSLVFHPLHRPPPSTLLLVIVPRVAVSTFL